MNEVNEVNKKKKREVDKLRDDVRRKVKDKEKLDMILEAIDLVEVSILEIDIEDTKYQEILKKYCHSEKQFKNALELARTIKKQALH